MSRYYEVKGTAAATVYIGVYADSPEEALKAARERPTASSKAVYPDGPVSFDQVSSDVGATWDVLSDGTLVKS